MLDATIEAEQAVHAARNKVLRALNDATRDGDAADLSRHLTCLNYLLMGCEFTAAEARNAATCIKAIRSHYEATHAGGEGGR
jgi:predicted small metal-binding protein